MDTGDLKSILFIMFANLKLVLRRYTSLYGIFMSASLTLYIYTWIISYFLFTMNMCKIVNVVLSFALVEKQ